MSHVILPAVRWNAAVALIAAVLLPGLAVHAAGLRAVSQPDGLLVQEGDHDVLFFQATPRDQDGQYRRAGYVHPLYDLNGRVITEDFPADHKHHRGIFWAWHQLLVNGKPTGDPWVCRDFLTRVDSIEPALLPTGELRIVVRSVWLSPQWTDADGNQKPIVHETVHITVHPRAEHTRTIDFDLSLLAAELSVQLGGSDDDKGYGGFSPRLKLPEDVRFQADYGMVEPQTQAVPASPWMDVFGTLEPPQTAASNEISGVAILCHRVSAGYPQPWILRARRSMQNPVWPGRTPVELSTTEPLRLSYRLVLHQGVATPEQIAEWSQAWQATNR